jgi:hypothetical protein
MHRVAANAVQLPNDTARVAFFYAALGSPPVTTLLAALRAKLLATLPITTAMVTRHPPNSTTTAAGHLDAHRQHVQPPDHARTVDSICAFPSATEPTERHKHKDIFVKFLVPKDELDIDLAVRLPIGDTWDRITLLCTITVLTMYTSSQHRTKTMPTERQHSNEASNFSQTAA